MRTRFTCVAAILALVAIGFLMACSSKYSSSSSNNGLLVVPTQGSAVMQTFNLDLANGHVSQINNSAGPPTPGLPKSVILDPAGAFAYVIVYANPSLAGSVTGVASFQVGSDGKLSYVGTTAMTNPVAMAIDSAGKFLFVANGTDGTVSSFSVGGNATLTAAGTTSLPQVGGQTPSASALAVTPTVYPVQYAYCSGFTPPATENVYVADSANYVLFNYMVSSTGSLIPTAATNGISTGTVPAGVAVDPCNRFVYVTNSLNNSVSAYTICNAVSLPTNCPIADFSLQAVVGSPFPTGDLPGPLAVDPYGNFLYVVDTGGSQISGYRISAASGALAALTSTTTTNSGANSIAIRSDDNWLFVANFNSSNVSQYAITPAIGTLTPQAPFVTLNSPTGVAVK